MFLPNLAFFDDGALERYRVALGNPETHAKRCCALSNLLMLQRIKSVPDVPPLGCKGKRNTDKGITELSGTA